MTSVLPAIVCLVIGNAGLPANAAKVTPTTFEGKVLPLTKALEKLGVKPDQDTTGVVLVTADGTHYTLIKDEASRLLFLDPKLHERTMRLTGKVIVGTQMLKVEKVQSTKAGKVFNIDYWCENCQLAATEPGKCKCCGSDTVLRELPVK